MNPHRAETSRTAAGLGLFLAAAAALEAQNYSTLTGRVIDPSENVVSGAEVLVKNLATLVERVANTNNEGLYEFAGLPVGPFRVQVRAPGFRLYTVEALTTEVGRNVVVDVRLEIGDVSHEITVKSRPAVIDGDTTSGGHVVDERTIQETPLNGRYFLDLALLAPGSVTPSQNGFSTTPSRGSGALAINTAGNREETVNYRINGIALTNSVSSAISFQPSISTVQEFKIDNTAFSAEYGQSSGAIVNMATRSGTSDFHGELFEFLRNDALDARNFFNFNSSEPPPFKRNQFGGTLGGPIVRSRTFFFLSYEGLRQAQGLNMNSVVLSDAERASVVDPVITKLVELIPRSNFTDSGGTPRYVGWAPGPVNVDQWAIDINHTLSRHSRLHGYYTLHHFDLYEPGSRGTTVPNFGGELDVVRQFFSLNETHTFGGNAVNEARVGFNRLSSESRAHARYNADAFGIRNGVNQAIGLPQISIAGGNLSFGGPAIVPLVRGDTTIVASDTFSWLHGRQSLKFGGEYRTFLSNSRRLGPGMFNFASIPTFLAGNANSFSITLGNQSSSIDQGALEFFIQTNYRLKPHLSLQLGLRYAWNMTPEERFGRFIVFDPRSGSLEYAGEAGEDVYHQNNKNFQPRVSFAWDLLKDGKTSLRGAYAVTVDQPMTSIVTPLSANPPLSIPLTFAGAIRFESAIDTARAAGLAPASIDRGFDNAYVQSWNLNVHRELPGAVLAMAGYFGAKGTNLILRRNLNQPLNGVRPYVTVSSSSAILPGTPLGNITQVESTGNSSYNALWLSTSRRFGRGLHINSYYTWSKSLDYNSLSTQGIVVQNSNDLRGDRGRSDFDARHRFVVNARYELPIGRNLLLKGWQIAVLLQSQSGNPVNIVTTNSTTTGVANTLRPDAAGPVAIVGDVERWFDTSAFTPVSRFGNLGRNSITGPGFHNTDVSLMKDTVFAEKIRLQFRAELFNLFNHPNFGQPGNVVGTPGFGRITNTRFPTGESGSSRQAQLGMKLIF
jgi:hypothetical protein